MKPKGYLHYENNYKWTAIQYPVEPFLSWMQNAIRMGTGVHMFHMMSGAIPSTIDVTATQVQLIS